MHIDKTAIFLIGVGLRLVIHVPSLYCLPTHAKDKYIILTETNNGFDIEKKYIEYDKENLKQSINISDLSDRDKIKINDWSGVGRGRWILINN